MYLFNRWLNSDRYIIYQGAVQCLLLLFFEIDQLVHTDDIQTGRNVVAKYTGQKFMKQIFLERYDQSLI